MFILFSPLLKFLAKFKCRPFYLNIRRALSQRQFSDMPIMTSYFPSHILTLSNQLSFVK